MNRFLLATCAACFVWQGFSSETQTQFDQIVELRLRKGDYAYPVVGAEGSRPLYRNEKGEIRKGSRNRLRALLSPNTRPDEIPIVITESLHRGSGMTSSRSNPSFNGLNNPRVIEANFQMSRYVSFVAKEKIENVYAALLARSKELHKDGYPHLQVKELGDIEAGEEYQVVFHGIPYHSGPIERRVEFFKGDKNLKAKKLMIMEDPYSLAAQGYPIPFGRILNRWKSDSDKRNASAMPIRAELPEEFSSGLDADLVFDIKIQRNGKVQLLQTNPNLKEKNLDTLHAIVSEWRFLPEKKKGRLIETVFEYKENTNSQWSAINSPAQVNSNTQGNILN